MRKARLSLVLCTLLLVPFLFGVATADPVSAGDYIRLINRYGSPGGEFGIALSGDPTNELFRTFCLEYTEFISFGTDYYVDSITDRAINGGVGPMGDPISDETAWLYWAFRNGSLAGYANDAASADALQRAIWLLEDEGDHGDSALRQSFLAQANAAVMGGWTNNGKVGVMNLKSAPGGTLKQDQMILVPEPSTLLLLGAGLLGLALTLRKRHLRARA